MENVKAKPTPVWVFAPMLHALTLLEEFGRRRQMLASCGALSESLLRDIGVTPEDLEAALGAPLDQIASDEVLREAMARAGHW